MENKQEVQEVEVLSNQVALPVDTIKLAIQQGSDLELVKEAMMLQERWEANEARKAYFVSMAEAQKEMPIVIKDARNNQTNSKYAKEESISKTIKPAYTKYGFSLSFDIADSPLKDHIRVICYIQHSKGHIENRHIDYPYDIAGIKGTVNKTPIHAYKSTISYAKNTLTCMAFNVATGDDDDAPAATVDVISNEQLNTLRDLLISIGDEKNEGNIAKTFGYANFEELPVSKYQNALVIIKERKKMKEQNENN